MRFFNSARTYHQITKHSPEAVEAEYREVPFGKKAEVYKAYSRKPVYELPKNFNTEISDIEVALKNAGQFSRFHAFKNQSLNIEELSHLLYLVNGVNKVQYFPGHKIEFRSAPSAGAFYPTEIYLFATNVEGLDKGIYYFHPGLHQLVQLQKDDIETQLSKAVFGLKAIHNSAVTIFLTSVFSRNAWKFKHRSFRYCLLDAGYVAENLLISAAAKNLAVNLVGDFMDNEVNRLLDLEKGLEKTMLIASVGYKQGPMPRDEYEFSMPNDAGINEFTKDLDPVEFIYQQSKHYEATQFPTKVNVRFPFSWQSSPRIIRGKLFALPKPKKLDKKSTHEILEIRRSQHNFKMVPVSLEELSTILAASRSTADLYDFRVMHTLVGVNDVEGLEKGAYIYHPDINKLELVQSGDFRGDMSFYTLNQDIVFNSSAVIFFAVNFEDINLFSNRGYRYACINAGMYSENIYLSAVALEIGARGIGNFFDNLLNDFFMLRKPHENIIGGVAIGRI